MAARRGLLLTAMDDPAQERARRQHHRAGPNRPAIAGDDPRHRAVLHDQVLDRRLDHLQVRRRPDRRLHGGAIELAVGLGARALHGRPLGAVEQAELDAGGIGHPPHQPIQRIDLAHQMPLAESADGRIAGHLADGGKPVRDQRRARAHPGGDGRRLAARMAAADDDDVVGFGVHGTTRFRPEPNRNVCRA